MPKKDPKMFNINRTQKKPKKTIQTYKNHFPEKTIITKSSTFLCHNLPVMNPSCLSGNRSMELEQLNQYQEMSFQVTSQTVYTWNNKQINK